MNVWSEITQIVVLIKSMYSYHTSVRSTSLHSYGRYIWMNWISFRNLGTWKADMPYLILICRYSNKGPTICLSLNNVTIILINYAVKKMPPLQIAFSHLFNEQWDLSPSIYINLHVWMLQRIYIINFFSLFTIFWKLWVSNVLDVSRYFVTVGQKICTTLN